MIVWLETIFPNMLIASRDAAVLSLCIGLLLWSIGKKIPSNWRHAIWLIVAIRLLLPVLPGSAFSWHVLLEKAHQNLAMSVPEERITPPDDGKKSPLVILQMIEGVEIDTISRNSLPSGALEFIPKLKPDFFSIASMIWGFGFVICLFVIGILSFRFRRNAIRLLIDDHPRKTEVERTLSRLCQKFGISKVPGLIITEAVQSPALTGAMKRNVLLPPSSLELLDKNQIELVLIHELAHLRRFDLWTGWVLCMLQAVHWFNPFVWWAFHRVRIEAERATDDWVLRHSGAEYRQDYGEMLLRLLESANSRNTSFPGVVGVLESRRDLHHRLAAIGGFRKHKSRLAAIGAVALISGLAVVGLTQAPQEKENKPKVVSEKESQTPESSSKPKTPSIAAKDLDSLNPFPAPGPGDPPLGKSREAIEAFIKAPNWEARIPLTYQGDRLKPTIAEYYKNWQFSRRDKFSMKFFHTETDKVSDGPYWVYLLSTNDGDAGFPIIVRVENGKLKVDWEIYSDFQDRHFVEFKNGRLTGSNSFRVVLGQNPEYLGPDRERFTNRDDYLCFDVSPPYGNTGEFSQRAFVRKGTPLAKRLNKDIALGTDLLAVIVTLDFKTFPHGVKHMIITEWIAEGWFSKTQVSNETAKETGNVSTKKNQSLQILLPEGKTPASGAKLMMYPQNSWAYFEDLEKTNSESGNPSYVFDELGELKFPETPLSNGWIVHPKGYLQVTKEILNDAKIEPLRLKPYTKIFGRLLINGKLAANRTLVFYSNIQWLTDNEKSDGWQITVPTDEKGHFTADRLIPTKEAYQIYIVDRLTGRRTGYKLGVAKAPNTGNANVIALNFDEAARVNVKGRFVTRDGKPLKSLPLKSVFASYHSLFGTPDINTGPLLEKDGTFLTVATLPGRYSLSGNFRFSSGETFNFEKSPWIIPADAIEKAKDGIYDIGDIPIDYPIKTKAAPVETNIPDKVNITVVDEQTGEPLQGAKIVPTDLGTVGGSGLVWDKGLEKIDPKQQTTDQDGVVEIRYPLKSTRKGSGDFGNPDIKYIYVSVSHSDYPSRYVSISTQTGSRKIKMQKGAILKVIPQRADKGPVNEKGVTVQVSLMGKEIPASEWKWETLSGIGKAIVHHRIPAGAHLVRSIYLDEDKQLFYSDAHPHSFKSGGEIVLPVTLKRGLVFAGSLDKNVPRPVKEGWITVGILPNDDSLERLYGLLPWIDNVKVDENGNFRLPGIPPGAIFVHAGCKGWANEMNPIHRPLDHQEIDQNERKNAIIEMKPNGNCRVTVLKPDGSPLTGAKILMYPNQRILRSFNTNFGYALKNQGLSNDKSDSGNSADLMTELNKKWQALTDKNGVATISDLPYDRSEMIQIKHPEFRIPLNRHQQRIFYTKVETGRTVEVTLKMERKH